MLLKEENETLKERLNNLSYIISDLNTKVKDSENEKVSLATAIKIIRKENQHAMNSERGCQTQKHKRKTKQVTGTGNTDSRNFDTRNTSIGNTDARNTDTRNSNTRKTGSGNTDHFRNIPVRSKSRVVILGDAMIQHLNPRQLQNDINRKVAIKTLPRLVKILNHARAIVNSSERPKNICTCRINIHFVN